MSRRSWIQALGGTQTVALGAVYLVLAAFAMAAIGFFVSLSTQENASAVMNERAVTQLQILLRGLNEAVVSQGALASLEVVKQASQDFEAVRPAIAAEPGAPSLEDWSPTREGVEKLMRDRRNVAFDDDALIALGRVSTRLGKIVQALTEWTETKRARANRAQLQALVVIAAASLLILLGTLGIFVAFHRNVTRPVEAAIGFADRVAQGDLTARAARREGQAGRLLAALGNMCEDLGRIVAQVRGGTDNIESAASQLSEGNAELSSRTERQATALEETASSLEELSTVVDDNAANSKRAREMALHAKSTAAQGDEVVGQFVVRMEAIQQSSRRISEIIGVIDDIAFQTNILALNAAVEAARAGEQGRGFAVVAAEVRGLAQRSATAAKEIKQLIRDSVEQVEAGGRVVEASRRTMHDIGAAIDEVTRAMEQISLASSEQAAGIRQVSGAIVQLDQTVQQNAALVEEIAGASQSLHHQATELKQAVHFFKVEARDAAANAAAHFDAGPLLTPV